MNRKLLYQGHLFLKRKKKESANKSKIKGEEGSNRERNCRKIISQSKWRNEILYVLETREELFLIRGEELFQYFLEPKVPPLL